MTNALLAKNKIGFVDGTLKQPAADSADLSFWIRCDAMVKGWIKSAMEKDVRKSVRYAKTAREIWSDLSERFGKGSAPRLYELRRDIACLRQDKQLVALYYTKLKALWDEAQSINSAPKCSCGGCKCEVERTIAEARDRDLLYDFLMGLNEEFGTVKTHILSTKPLMSVSAAYHLVSEDEKQRQVSTMQKANVEAMAFQVRGVGLNKGTEDRRDGRREKI